MKTIYNTYVVMESQEQCDRMKQLCIDNGLPYWCDEEAFLMYGYYKFFDYGIDDFWISSFTGNKKQVTEEEFIELLKTK